MRTNGLKRSLLRSTSAWLSLALLIAPAGAQTPAVGAAPAGAPPVVTPPPAAPVPAPAQPVIRRIQVLGTQRIEPSTVLTYISMREGDVFDRDAVDVALKALFATGLFTSASRIDWDPVTGTLTVRVSENPIVNQVVFEGNSKMSSKDLTKELQIKPRSVFTQARVQTDVQRLMEVYRRNGRFAARIDPQIISRPQNRVDLIFAIDEGPSTGISRINFAGNRAFSDSALRSQIATEESNGILTLLSTNDNYDPDRLDYDKQLLTRFYNQRGYHDFKVTSAVAQLAPGGTSFYVNFTVDEGVKYTFGKITINSKIPELTQPQLMPLLAVRSGQIYNRDLVQKGLDTLTNAAGGKGYAFATVNPRLEANPKTRTIDITFNIDQGPRVYIEHIDITGNTRTLDKVIRREFRLVEGDAFNRALVDRSQARIRSLGFFKDVSVKPAPGSQPDRTNLTVAVTEQSTGSISVGLGYSSYSSLIGDVSYTEINLFGRGQQLSAVARMSQIQKQFQLSFSEPWFLDRPLSAGFDLQKVINDYQQAAFQSDVSAASLRFGFPVTEYSSVQLYYMYKIQKVNVFGAAPIEILLDQGTQNGSILGFTYLFADLDDARKPVNGATFSVGQNFAGFGGSLRYLESVASFGIFHGMFDNSLPVSLTGRVKYITGYDGTPVPVNSRYFEGGDTFRGFSIAGVGPRDLALGQLGAVGGNFSAIGTVAARLPGLLPESFGVNMSLFTDFGTIGHVDTITSRACTTTSCLRDNLAFRASAGVSVQWKSPFGPLNIDLGIPFVKAPYDREQIIHFSTGTGF
ncbi:MAG: outer membrane protein assembly factor BamA [Alphaproteobacteria bacterium]|nr:outer membrane protein assembly factor BamA [Alphaproteobacteria bacterium]